MGEFICGFELHLPLDCESKLFCSCPIVQKDAEPNTATCPICLGHPGSKPVLNKKAVDYAIKLALALNCRVEKEIVFSRKTYFYPDLAKNFQISQYDAPLGNNGFIALDSGKKIKIRRVHLEEDPGALVHESGMHGSMYVLVDYNRSGVPLCEVVTEPDISSKEEAKEFLDKLNLIVDYLGIFNSGKFVIKADTNISIKGGERVEVKNVTGTKNVELVLLHELERQKTVITEGGKIEMETRGFDEASGTTYTLRKKESEEDYGFIVDADLVPTQIDASWLEKIRKELPEMSEEKAKRFMGEFGLKEYDAKVLAQNKDIAQIFEDAAKVDVQIAARIVSRELLGILNYNSLGLADTKITAKGISALVALLKGGKVSDKNAKESLIKYALEGIEPKEFLEKNKLLIDVSSGDLEKAVKEAVAENASAFTEFKTGNSKSMNFLIGTVMRKMKGKADARAVQKILEEMK
ncbi:MAG TPA: Asp-tRNA(Asn)/Glu-tRNA(Gln) amidotransferase subunit GatB [archaeon]|nr:Asp-tRNA(Asn)/Glu-tRNA(Gln) amidotransferase subunit GatB [archaeon]